MKGPPSLPVVALLVHWQIDVLPFPPQDLLLCANYWFVAAMVAGVHPANQNMTEGAVRAPRSR